MGFWFANITSFIVELDLKDALKRRRSMVSFFDIATRHSDLALRAEQCACQQLLEWWGKRWPSCVFLVRQA